MIAPNRAARLLSIACLLLIASVAPARTSHARRVEQHPSTTDSLTASIDAEFRTYADRGLSGAVLVAKNDKVVLQRSYGDASSLGAHPAFWIASCSKSFTAAAILKLQEQGRLSLGDSLPKFLVDVPSDKQHITIHQLLDHTSGLPDKYAADGITDRAGAARAILALPLGWSAGEGYHYSNDGYSLLAIIVEIASRTSFEDYLRREILRPAGLRHTGFWGHDRGGRLAPFAKGTNTRRVSPTIYHSGKTVANWGWRGAAGLYSTTSDLYQWMRALRMDKVLSPASREQLWGKQVLLAHVSPIEDAYYGYGWGLRFMNGTLFYARHLGEDTWSGHNAAMALYANGDAFVVLSNSGAKDDAAWSLVLARSLHKRFGE